VEALGRFLSQNVKIYIQTMSSKDIETRLLTSESGSWEYPTEGAVTCQDINLKPPANHLFHYMLETGILIGF